MDAQEPASTWFAPATHQQGKKSVNFGDVPWCEHVSRPETAKDGDEWECPDGCGTAWTYRGAVELWTRVN